LVARYRLRFLLQEIDIARGETLLGRSADCHVTIEDPLVSRTHARIVLENDEATIFDLGSRNGVKVNGSAIKTQQLLKDGDRIRIGTQELVFCRVEVVNMAAKTTGFLRHCARCKMPYAREAGSCPNCGGTEQIDEETLSGRFGTGGQGAWSVQLLIEVVERALAADRIEEAERMLLRTIGLIDERANLREGVDPRQLAAVSDAALDIGNRRATKQYATWVMNVHKALQMLPAERVIAGLGQALATHPDLAAELESLITELASPEKTFSEDDSRSLAALEALRVSATKQTPSGKTRSAIS
jgi:hypothetical protein